MIFQLIGRHYADFFILLRHPVIENKNISPVSPVMLTGVIWQTHFTETKIIKKWLGLAQLVILGIKNRVNSSLSDWYPKNNKLMNKNWSLMIYRRQPYVPNGLLSIGHGSFIPYCLHTPFSAFQIRGRIRENHRLMSPLLTGVLALLHWRWPTHRRDPNLRRVEVQRGSTWRARIWGRGTVHRRRPKWKSKSNMEISKQ